jgi:hypothetical protein
MMDKHEAFLLATTRVLPAAIQAEIKAPGRYSIGNVVYHSAKPTIVSWRKQSIQFAAPNGGETVSLKSILVPQCTKYMNQLRPQSTLFSNTGARDTTREFKAEYGGKAVDVRAEFGAIYQTTSNLLRILDSRSGELKADLENAVVQKVLGNGGRFFVVSTVYEGENVEIFVREENAQEEHESGWRNVLSRPEKTVLGFMLTKLSISSSDGVVTPVWHIGYTPYSICMEESVSEENDMMPISCIIMCQEPISLVCA